MKKHISLIVNETIRIRAFNRTHNNIVDADQVPEKPSEILRAWYQREFSSKKQVVNKTDKALE